MFYNSSGEYNDCVSKGACSIPPNISSMQEIMLVILRQISYYLIKLKNFEYTDDKILYDLIYQLAFIDAFKDFSEAQILDLFSKQYINLVNAKKMYLKLCSDNNEVCNDLKNFIKISPKSSLSNILQLGEKEFINKYKKLSAEKKYFYEILLSVMKSVSVNLINLKEYQHWCNKGSELILDSLNILNFQRVAIEKLKFYIDKLAQCDIEILDELSCLEIEKFGPIEKTEVSHSTRKHNAILVSGSNLNDLDALLKAVENEDIDVYTNGNLLISHAFSHFKEYKNLKGHFGNGTNNTLLDFATFPGAILLTKHESQNIEYLYRGRLFTTDEIQLKGVNIIQNSDFSKLIESAKQAKGFAKGQIRAAKTVGFDEDKLNEIFDKIIQNNPKRIFIIGLSDTSHVLIDYFKKFLSILPNDCTAISFSYNSEKENVIHFDVGNNHTLMFYVLKRMFDKINVNSDSLVFFLTKCDINSLSNMIYLKNRGAKNIYLSSCTPLVINPAVMKVFNKLYNIKSLTNPKDDINEFK